MTVKKIGESIFDDLQRTCLKLNNAIHRYDAYSSILLDAARTATGQVYDEGIDVAVDGLAGKFDKELFEMELLLAKMQNCEDQIFDILNSLK